MASPLLGLNNYWSQQDNPGFAPKWQLPSWYMPTVTVPQLTTDQLNPQWAPWLDAYGAKLPGGAHMDTSQSGLPVSQADGLKSVQALQAYEPYDQWSARTQGALAKKYPGTKAR
jgi:hypothetical protein